MIKGHLTKKFVGIHTLLYPRKNLGSKAHSRLQTQKGVSREGLEALLLNAEHPLLNTTPSGKNCISFNFNYFWMTLRGADWVNLRIGSAENIFFPDYWCRLFLTPRGPKLLIWLGVWGAPPPQEKGKRKIGLKWAENGTFWKCHRIQTVIDINLKIGLVVHWDQKRIWFFIKLVIHAQWGATGPRVTKT